MVIGVVLTELVTGLTTVEETPYELRAGVEALEEDTLYAGTEAAELETEAT